VSGALRVRDAAGLVMGAVLRAERQSRQWSAPDAGRMSGQPVRKVRRIESGHPEGTRDLSLLYSLARLYGLSDASVAALVRLLVTARPDGSATDDGPGWAGRVAACERAAGTITAYAAWAFPPVVALPAYASAAGAGRTGGAAVDRLLAAGHGKSVSVLVEEAVLFRPFGGARVFAAQLGHVLDLVRSGAAGVRVVPLGTGPPVRGGLSELWWQPVPLYIAEEPRLHALHCTGRYAEHRGLRRTLEAARRAALPQAESTRRLEEAIRRYGDVTGAA
jgi:transcriptional regulator with XRE-family HTH domain